MLEDPTQPRAAFVTFYSCKGGVGRSMALINVAGILAGRGFRVLALDMDLEAPGISYLMQHEAHKEGAQTPGFVDLLADACARGPEADLFALDPAQVVERYSYAYTVPKDIRPSEEGLLRIMPAGRLDDGYQARLDALMLGQLYRDGRGQPLIAAFKQVIQDADQFDFVFVDSRTGFSDEAGICTRDLADYLMIVMGLNRQNVEGTAAFLRSLRQTGVSTPLRVTLSPVPHGEDELIEQREKEAGLVLEAAYGEPVDLSLQIPYHPRLALTEEPHIFRRSRGYLFDAYARMERAVLAMMGQTAEGIRGAIEVAAKSQRVDLVLPLLNRLRKVDEDFATMNSLVVNTLAKLCFKATAMELRRFLAEVLPAGAIGTRHLAEQLGYSCIPDAQLFYQRAIEGAPHDPAMFGSYAIFLINMADRGDADTQYQRAESSYPAFMESSPHDPNDFGNYAKILFVRNRVDEGVELLQEAWSRLPVGTDLECELHFYGYAHAAAHYPGSLSALKRQLTRGARSPDWPLTENVRVAIEQGHPAPLFLAALARVVSGEAGIETLDAFPEWQDPSGERT
jgi:MinD-like ATPase involved in chromosome partitioning or flagellar assembly